MAKYPTNPTLYNEVLQINISKLKQLGYLKPNEIKSGILTWSRGGNSIGKIRIITNTVSNYIELDYSYKDIPRNYKVNIISVPSNLGKGDIMYFICPSTNKRCRILYSIGGYFLHRTAFKGCMYECQKESRKYRGILAILVPSWKVDDYHEKLNKKYFKRMYAGKPTKRYLQIMKQIKKAEKITPEMYQRLLLS